jgi:5'-nucleotidase
MRTSPATALPIVLALLHAPAEAGEPRAADTAKAPTRITLSIVATNDLHGHIEALPRLGGYVANLRQERARTGGGVVLLDGGDMLHGTLESNLNEGAAVVRAYNALKYDAVAVGNHEFDFGPVGPPHTPENPGDDPQGALKARAAEAQFPFLAANLVDAEALAPLTWPNFAATKLIDVANVKVGIIGLANVGTAFMTQPANFANVRALPPLPIVMKVAKTLRERGAAVVVVVAHVGGSCTQVDNPNDLSSCDAGSEIFRLARALPRGTVDAIVAGHTHAGIAHRVAGIPIVETYDKGYGFGRIDLELARPTKGPPRIVGSAIFPPKQVPKPDAPLAETYEHAEVKPDPAVEAAIAPALAAARRQRQQKIGVTIVRAVARAASVESPLGNLVADLMRAARPKADIALLTGGSLRTDLPAGALTYQQLYEAFPFDDRFVTIPVTADDLARIVVRNLESGGAIILFSGLHVMTDCMHSALGVTLTRPNGAPIGNNERLTLVTTEFLASGGGDVLPAEVRAHASRPDGKPIRDALADLLRARKALDPAKPLLYDVEHPRLDYPGRRPVRCTEFSAF